MTWRTVRDGSSIFDSKCQIITIPVNCVGVMGAGLAFDAKRKWPNVSDVYKQLCRAGLISLGHPQLIHRLDGTDGQVLLFPTKHHFSEISDIRHIDRGLNAVWEMIHAANYEFPPIALPALGCGLGGLDWVRVEELIHYYLKPLDDVVDFEVYPPGEPHREGVR